MKRVTVFLTVRREVLPGVLGSGSQRAIESKTWQMYLIRYLLFEI